MSTIKPPFTHDELIKTFKIQKPELNELDKMIEIQTLMRSPVLSNSKFSIDTLKAKSSKSNTENLCSLLTKVNLGSLGKHNFPPKMETTQIDDNEKNEIHSALEAEPNIPKHLHYRFRPEITENLSSIKPKFKFKRKLWKNIPHNIFGEDDRIFNSSTAYPFSAIGVVETGNGPSTGVMVGPRHMLTVSHAMDWDNGGGWVRFTPSSFDGSAPFGTAFGIRTYYQTQVTGNIGSFEGRRDYAVVVLNWPIGRLTGWLGTKSYENSWDGGNYWTHMGYPGDIGGGRRRTWQSSLSLNALGVRERAMRMSHKADAVPGHSGGPFYGFWRDGPYVVAVQSHTWAGVFRRRNYSSGGRLMTRLVVTARNDFP